MIDNPYESPRPLSDTTTAEPPSHTQARRSFRVALSVLLLPAIYNYWEFDAQALNQLPADLAILCRVANVLGIGIVGVALWFLGLPSLTALARLLQLAWASTTDRAAWQEILDRSLIRVMFLAIPGAALWAIWVFAFYQLKLNFYAISWAVGIPAHLLAASWYIPLIYRWSKLAASSPAPNTSQHTPTNPTGNSSER